jgi:hypothetical protein
MKFGTKVIWGLGLGRYAQAGVNSFFFIEDCRCIRRNFRNPNLNLNPKGSVSVADTNGDFAFIFILFYLLVTTISVMGGRCFPKLPGRSCFRFLLAMSIVAL